MHGSGFWVLIRNSPFHDVKCGLIITTASGFSFSLSLLPRLERGFFHGLSSINIVGGPWRQIIIELPLPLI